MCPVVGSWLGKDYTAKAAGVLETELTAAGIPHDLKVYPAPSTRSSTTNCGSTTLPRRRTRGSGCWPSSPTMSKARRDRRKPLEAEQRRKPNAAAMMRAVPTFPGVGRSQRRVVVHVPLRR
ncbi:MAG TPA: hypothetical protein VGF32_19705 [Streptosporangiaceae bacterium]|jgi:hypothetical protein